MTSGPVCYRLRITRRSWTGEDVTRELGAILAVEPRIGDRLDTLETTGHVTGRIISAAGMVVLVEENS